MIELIIGIIIRILKPIKFIVLFLYERKKQKYNQIVKLYKLINSDDNKKILLVSERFKDLTSLKMSYNNIKTLLEDNNALIIIYLLKNYKNLYDYNDNKFISLESKKWRDIKKIFSGLFLIGIVISLVFITLYMLNSNLLIDKIMFSIVIVFTSLYLIIYIKINEDIKFGEKIIKQYEVQVSEHTNTNGFFSKLKNSLFKW